MAREYFSRFQCGHAGCPEFAHYSSSTRAEQTDLQRKYANGRWLCTRHSRPGEVLSAEVPKIVHEIVSREVPHGRYFGNFGFLSGPGFMVFALDFPPGTILKVTAEVILPEAGRLALRSLDDAGAGT